ncbi:MAG: hypothetical protein MK213_07190, partial [Planctomycetes bacterium]|nr:hypothetical protein [Planctomycetota bacterium]
ILFPVLQYRKTKEWILFDGTCAKTEEYGLALHSECKEGLERLYGYLSRSDMSKGEFLNRTIRESWNDHRFRVMILLPREIPDAERWAELRGPDLREVAFASYTEDGKNVGIGMVFARSPEALWNVAQRVEWLKGIAESLRGLHPEAVAVFFADDHPDFPGFTQGFEGDYPC